VFDVIISGNQSSEQATQPTATTTTIDTLLHIVFKATVGQSVSQYRLRISDYL